MPYLSSNITIEQLDSFQKETKDLFIKKNTSYNNKLTSQGTINNIIRINDIINELDSITINGETNNRETNIRDTLIELLNSVTMRIMVLDNNNYNINKWTIQGSSGNIYARENITYPDGRKIRTCTCPSYKYSTNESKYCKHTKNDN